MNFFELFPNKKSLLKLVFLMKQSAYDLSRKIFLKNLTTFFLLKFWNLCPVWLKKLFFKFALEQSWIKKKFFPNANMPPPLILSKFRTKKMFR